MFTERELNETNETVVTKPFTQKEQDLINEEEQYLINEEMKRIAEAEKEKYQAEKEMRIEQEIFFENYKNILVDFLNRNVGDYKTEMYIHARNKFFWELFKEFAKKTKTKSFTLFKIQNEDVLDFASVYLLGVNGNVINCIIYKEFLQSLKEYIPNMYLTSGEVENYTKLFNE